MGIRPFKTITICLLTLLFTQLEGFLHGIALTSSVQRVCLHKNKGILNVFCAIRSMMVECKAVGDPSMFPPTEQTPPQSSTARMQSTMLEDNDLVEPEKPSRLLSERVSMTVSNIRRRMSIFRKYARDIQGKTGLGAIAALQYVDSVIRNRESVWGDLVMIVMQSKPKQVQDIILNTAREVLSAPIDEAQWIWFRDNLLSTFVWFSPSVSRPGSYLYEHLLDIASANIQAQAQLVNSKRFPTLESNIPSATYLPGGEDGCRQDHRLIGQLPDIVEQALLTPENKHFYDLNVYLNKLICVARVVDPEFQAHISGLFAGLRPAPAFQPGPPKSLARCRAKAQTDYSAAAWPSSARLLDMVRCSVTFRTEQDLYTGYQHLLAAAAAGGAGGDPLPAAAAGGGEAAAAVVAAGPRIEIARVKNGFRPGKVGYRDVKVTVVFRSGSGSGAALAGEVALVLEELAEYRRATHELYEILREREFFEQVVHALQGFL